MVSLDWNARLEFIASLIKGYGKDAFRLDDLGLFRFSNSLVTYCRCQLRYAESHERLQDLPLTVSTLFELTAQKTSILAEVFRN